MSTERARLVLALCLMTALPGCVSALLPKKTPARVEVVVTPGALDPCVLSYWLVPDPLNADQAAELAQVARDESKACAKRHDALIDDVRKHNEKAE